MDIQTKKIHFIQKFLALNNEAVIDKLEAVLSEEVEKNMDGSIDLEQYNHELEQANARIEKGDFFLMKR